MAKDRKKIKENASTWLEGMRKAIGSDIVVSVLVTKKGLSFVSCVDRNRWFNSDDIEEQDDEPEKNVSEHKPRSLSDYGGYIQ